MPELEAHLSWERAGLAMLAYLFPKKRIIISRHDSGKIPQRMALEGTI